MLVIQYEDQSELRPERLPPLEDDVLECQECGCVWNAIRPLGSDWALLRCPGCGVKGAELVEPEMEKPPLEIKGGRFDHLV